MTSKGCICNGRICPNCGKIHKDTTGKNNGMANPLFRKKVSDRLKEEYKKGTLTCGFKKGEKKSEDHKLKISKSLKGKPKFKNHINNWLVSFKSTVQAEGYKSPNRNNKRPDFSKIVKERAKLGLMSGQYASKWQGGKTFELYPEGWNKKLKIKIRKRDKFTCNICKKNGYVVHHINRNKKDIDITNLITLCPSCHAKLHNNKRIKEGTHNFLNHK